MTTFESVPGAIGFVRAWVRLYTAGLPAQLRDGRREEIDSDLWEQAYGELSDARSGLATHVLLRWLLGVPGDLLWRASHIRSRQTGSEVNGMVQARNFRNLTVATGIVAALVLAALLVFTVVSEIEYQRQTDFEFFINWQMVLGVIGPLSVVAIVAGFKYMRSAPTLGAMLVVSGAAAGAIMFYWLIVPEVVAAVLAFYAIRRARKIREP